MASNHEDVATELERLEPNGHRGSAPAGTYSEQSLHKLDLREASKVGEEINLPSTSAAAYDKCNEEVGEEEIDPRIPVPSFIRRVPLLKSKSDLLKMHAFPTADNKVDPQYEEFQQYLEETGTFSRMSNALEKLLETSEFGKNPPKDPMKYFLSIFGEGFGRKTELRTLKQEVLKLENEMDRLEDENMLLRKILKIPEPVKEKDDIAEFEDIWDDVDDDDDLPEAEKLKEIDRLLKVYDKMLEETESASKEATNKAARQPALNHTGSAKPSRERQVAWRAEGDEETSDPDKEKFQVDEDYELESLLRLTDDELKRFKILADRFSDSDKSENEVDDDYRYQEEVLPGSKCASEEEEADPRCEKLKEMKQEIEKTVDLDVELQDEDSDNDEPRDIEKNYFVMSGKSETTTAGFTYYKNE